MGKYSPEFTGRGFSRSLPLNFVKKVIEDRGVLESIVIKCDNENTLYVRIGDNITGRIPFDKLEYRTDGKSSKPAAAKTKVGKHIKFMIESIKFDGESYVAECSRREAQRVCYENYVLKLRVGDVVPARVVRIENYGVFCDIGCGIVALLPTNLISITHTVNPKEMLAEVKELKVVIKNIDKKTGRIELSHRELLGTWEENASKFNKGQIVYGTVLSVESYGVFVRIAQNLGGLAEIKDGVELKANDAVSVRINNVSSENMKVKLSIVEKICNADKCIDHFDYIFKGKHIKHWVYSTKESKKVIESKFETLQEEGVTEE